MNFVMARSLLPGKPAGSDRRAFSAAAANPFRSLLRLGRFPSVLGLATSFFFLQLAAQMLQSTWCCSPNIASPGPNVTSACRWRWLGSSSPGAGRPDTDRDSKTRRAGCRSLSVSLFCIVGLIWFAVATQGWMMYAAMLPYAMIGISRTGGTGDLCRARFAIERAGRIAGPR